MDRQPQDIESDAEGMMTMQQPRKRQRTGLDSAQVMDPYQADKLIKA